MTAATKGFTSIVERLLTAGTGSEAVNGAAGRENVEETAKLLAAVVVNHYTGGLLGSVQRPSCSTTLLRVADHMSERHNILFSRYNFSVFLFRNKTFFQILGCNNVLIIIIFGMNIVIYSHWIGLLVNNDGFAFCLLYCYCNKICVAL